MRWSTEKRLAFLEFRLFWDGHVNRGDLIDFFGISVPQASTDLGRYQEIAPHNIRYDKTRKTYIAAPGFQPLFFDSSADRYLAQLRAVAAGVLPKEETWLGDLPTYGVAPLLRRGLNVNIVRRVLDSVRSNAALHVYYQSHSVPGPTWRWIAPHAIVFDGFRWHARAWCRRRCAFADFVLARMLDFNGVEPESVDPRTDEEWHREVTLRLAPHPAMKEGVRRAIELDYGMTDGQIDVTTRICLSYYVERNFNLDLRTEVIPPERQQLVLVNREEVEAARGAAKAAAERHASAVGSSAGAAPDTRGLKATAIRNRAV